MGQLRLVIAAFVATAVVVGGTSTAEAGERPVVHTDYRAAEFSHPAAITNASYPLAAGTRFTYEGSANRGGSVSAHKVVLTVTDLVKKIDGLNTRLLWDVDSSDGVVNEAELAFVAQDDDGNVWNMGEYPEEYDAGQFTGAPRTWLVGVGDALAGVGMRNIPRPHTSQYLQAYIASIQFGDVAVVEKIIPKLCIKLGCFKQVVQIRETNIFASAEGYQLKYYAPGLGNIRIDFIGGTEQESLELTKVERLNRGEVTAARNAALRLDRRAYHTVSDVWGDSPPAHREGE